MAFDSIFPFLPANANSPPQLFPYDLIINTAFPGIEFIGTEPNALYQEIREVNGCLWIVTNAMYNENLLQWDQEVNQNTSLPAYALELCDGAMTRFYSPATLIPDTPITWTPLWTVTAIGLMDSTPLEITGVTDPMNQLQVTWDPGIGIAPTAREVDITDIASSANSLLDNLVVNGVQVWTVNKEGVLIHGEVPASAIFPPIPSFNNPTFTGTSTFTGPVVMDSSLTVDGPVLMIDGLTVTGNPINAFQLNVSNGATISGGLTVPDGEAVTGGLNTDTLGVSGHSFLNGGASVTGGLTTDTLDVTGNSILHNTTIATGDTISVNGTTPVVLLESTDGSITITQVSNHEYNIETGSIAGHIPIGGTVLNYGGSPTSLVIPANGTSWNVISCVFIAVVVTGTPNELNVTGTGGTAGGGWSGGGDPVTDLPNSTVQYTLQINGFANPGDTVTATTSSTGGATIVATNMFILATRIS